ncbi:DUF1295 domain-containing protein [Paractinoplanes atraurantiacus]|uniref:Steroid 5-alpha reductase family enzyme n=1 Tax=Paractinoplanes atraurantiacus TaxID=1036182 RepID=A0A285HRK3_9ACTN|nr:DUF1295 domain-containing protein [Actinoplanes atraurantiacus]SNY38327.1 Steroid 5-alpha reductase family enzyme [Actinoplanes atraurantiacus]
MAGFGVVTVAYVLAGLAAWGVAESASGARPLATTLVADVAATVVVFLGSLVVGNASLYDPYWSIAPPVMAFAWAAPFTAQQLVILAWAIRLTANWAAGWRGLGHEDWRYVRMREQRPQWLPFWVVSLVGIMVVPTLVVFAGMLPVWVAPNEPWSALDTVAVMVGLGAVAIEAVADRQVRRFTADPANRGKVLDRGLWRWSRHPNYLGEILFWFALWLFAPTPWWTAAGPVAMVLLFVFVSVPLMDRRSLQRRPGYADYMRRTPALLPIFRFRSGSPPASRRS